MTNSESYTVRLSLYDSKSLSLLEFQELNQTLLNQNKKALVKIKRSSGSTEFVTEEVLLELNAARKTKRNQKKLDELNSPKFNKRPSGLKAIFNKFV